MGSNSRELPPNSLFTAASLYNPLQMSTTPAGTPCASSAAHKNPWSNEGNEASTAKKAKIGRRREAPDPIAAACPAISKPTTLWSIPPHQEPTLGRLDVRRGQRRQ